MKTTLLLACCALVLAADIARAEETDPAEICKKVQAAYAALDTINVQGTITQIMHFSGMPGQPWTTKTSFSLKMKKPNQYLFTWDSKSLLPKAQKAQDLTAGTVWSDGRQPFICYRMGSKSSYCRMKDDTSALNELNVSGDGDLQTVAKLFLLLPVYSKDHSLFSKLVDPEIQRSERASGEECYVISHKPNEFERQTFWISKSTFLIRQYVNLTMPRSNEALEKEGRAMVESKIKGGGREVTDEQRAAMTKVETKEAMNREKSAGRGTSTTVFPKIDSPKLSDADFVFKVPAGTPYVVSPFGGLPENAPPPK